MSLDAVYKHKYYVDPSQVVIYQSEKTLNTYSDILIRDNGALQREFTFTAKVTSHRIILEVKSGYKTQLEISFKSVTNIKLDHKGVINRKTFIILHTNDATLFEFYGPNIEDLYKTMNSSYEARVWQVADRPTSSLYSGLGDIKSQIRAEVNETRAMVTSSTADVQSLINKSEKLREIITYLKKNTSNNASNQGQKSEIEEILASIDNVSMVTKEEAGKDFYIELAKSVFQVSKELLNRYHGIASLIDVYYITNEKRKIALISPDDLLQACKKFSELNLPIKLVEISKGLKVIQDANFNSDEDFERNLSPLIDHDEGISAEILSRKTKIPLLLAISKLQMALDRGKVILDDTMEGKRYFHNFILNS